MIVGKIYLDMKDLVKFEFKVNMIQFRKWVIWQLFKYRGEIVVFKVEFIFVWVRKLVNINK